MKLINFKKYQLINMCICNYSVIILLAASSASPSVLTVVHNSTFDTIQKNEVSSTLCANWGIFEGGL